MCMPLCAMLHEASGGDAYPDVGRPAGVQDRIQVTSELLTRGVGEAQVSVWSFSRVAVRQTTRAFGERASLSFQAWREGYRGGLGSR